MKFCSQETKTQKRLTTRPGLEQKLQNTSSAPYDGEVKSFCLIKRSSRATCLPHTSSITSKHLPSRQIHISKSS